MFRNTYFSVSHLRDPFVQNLLDLFAAGFIFFLFASVYRKRKTAIVRFWMMGWFFILLHFVCLRWRVSSPFGQTVQTMSILGTLILCALSLVLSHRALEMPRGLSNSPIR